MLTKIIGLLSFVEVVVHLLANCLNKCFCHVTDIGSKEISTKLNMALHMVGIKSIHPYTFVYTYTHSYIHYSLYTLVTVTSQLIGMVSLNSFIGITLAASLPDQIAIPTSYKIEGFLHCNN